MSDSKNTTKKSKPKALAKVPKPNVLPKVPKPKVEPIPVKKKETITSEADSLFDWNEIPGNDSEILLDFLKQEYSIDWVKTASIQKIDYGKTIKVYNDNNYLSLSLNNDKTNLNLKIDDGRADRFIAETRNGKLNIYENTTSIVTSRDQRKNII